MTAQIPLFTASPYSFHYEVVERNNIEPDLPVADCYNIPALSDIRLPTDHPIYDCVTADYGVGPGLYPGFRAFAAQYDQVLRDEALAGMTPAQIAAVWNQFADDGGSVIRWDEATGEYVTRDGTAYSVDDVHATVKGALGYRR